MTESADPMIDGPRVFSCEVQIRWGDSDRLGHVNNTQYLEYMQEARIQFLTSKRDASGKRPGAMVVRKMDIEFLHPLTDGSGPLTVEVSVLHIGNSSFTVRHVIKDNTGAVSAAGDALLVAFDVRTERSRPLSDVERSVIEPYLAHAAAQ